MKSLIQIILLISLHLVFFNSEGQNVSSKKVNESFFISGNILDSGKHRNDIARLGSQILILDHKSNGLNFDLTLKSYDELGNENWSSIVNLGQNEFGYKILVDVLNSFIYTIGIQEKTIYDTDVLVTKFSSTGTIQWTYSWDGGLGKKDLPIDAILKGGELYITGIANEQGANSEDIFLFNLNENGVKDWQHIPNYPYGDNPVKLLSHNNDLIIAANSYTSLSIRNPRLFKYDLNFNSAPLVHTVPSSKADYCTNIKIYDDTLYLMGRKDQSLHYDGFVEKYSFNFFALGSYTYDYQSHNDRILDCQFNNNSIDVISESKDDNNNTVTNLIRLNRAMFSVANVHYFEPSSLGSNVKYRSANETEDDIIYGLSHESQNSDSTAILVNIDEHFNKRFQWSNGNGGNRLLNNLLYANGEIFTVGTFNDNGNIRSYLAKKLLKEVDSRQSWDTTHTQKDTMTFIDSFKLYGQRIRITFNRGILKEDKLDNLNKQWFHSDSIIVSPHNHTFNDIWQEPDSVYLYKTYENSITSDTVDTNRAGRIFRIRDYSHSLTIQFSSSENIEDIQDSLSHHKEIMDYASLIYAPVTDDPLYTDHQFSLSSNTNSQYWDSGFQNGDMNIADAWEYTAGNNNVKVGISDNGTIWYKHEDLSPNNTLAKSVVQAGGNIDGTLGNLNKFQAHSTRVAGIVGAIKGNSKGISGIAGGDNNSSDEKSKLYSYKYDQHLDQALKHGVHILNSSWHGLRAWNEYYYYDLARSGTILISSRGNDRYFNGIITQPRNEDQYPSGFFPDNSISVGAHGFDGKFLKPFNHRGNNTTHFTKYGKELDFLAPGWSTQSNFILDRPIYKPNEPQVGVITTEFTTAKDFDKYSSASLTSAAAPNVSGLAALICAVQTNANDEVTTTAEDVEKLIGMSCMDITTDDDNRLNADYKDEDYDGSIHPKHPNWRPLPTIGFDENSGWGKVDAGKALYYAGGTINGSADFKVKHLFDGDNEITVNNSSFTLDKSNQEIGIFDNFSWKPEVNHQVDVYVGTIDLTISIPTGYKVFEPSWFTNKSIQQGAIWANSSVSNFMAPPSDQYFKSKKLMVSPKKPYLDIELINATQGRVKLKGFFYKITHDIDEYGKKTPLSNPKWVPFNPNYLSTKSEFGLSVHLVDNTVSVESQEPKNFEIYPNPTNDILNIVNTSLNVENFEIVNIHGKRIKEINCHQNQKVYKIDVGEFSPGVYYVRLVTSKNQKTEKFIKI